ncbi:MAG TPA: M20/M25/M40 family metallo-hydrolase, partial [Nitrososphaeraceae archaeon]|nr:M20/M25/M40 family metallo-hydrolase [Nitrososphaeraceae archaeon]
KSESISLDHFIESQIDLVSKSNIERWINSLTSFHNRHSKSIYIHQVANWLKKELEIAGYKDKDKIKEKDKDKYKDIVDFHVFRENGLELKNVICHKQGETNKIIIICGHYDTVLSDNVEDTVSRAPGANDNASGLAAILEIARILFSVDLKYSIRFALFSGEEQGLRGLEHYADGIKREKEDLTLLINLDMIGVPDYHAINKTIEKEDMIIQHNVSAIKKTIQIDVDKEFENQPSCNEIKENDKESDRYGTIMEQMAENYTDIQGEKGSVYSSDYCPFERLGYVVIGAYDRSAELDNPHYHSSSDIPANLDMEYLTSVTKMVLATILHVNRKNSS